MGLHCKGRLLALSANIRLGHFCNTRVDTLEADRDLRFHIKLVHLSEYNNFSFIKKAPVYSEMCLYYYNFRSIINIYFYETLYSNF